MEDWTQFEYCPKCQLIQPTVKTTEGGRTVQRCQACGSSVEVGLSLESADAAGELSLSSLAPLETEVPAELELTGAEPEGAPVLAVPTRPVPLSVWNVDGSTLRGQIHLRMNAEAHTGPETVQDRLNDSDLFLTLSLSGDPPVVFLNKIQLIRVELPEGEGLTDTRESTGDVTVEPIRVQLINGEQISGTVHIEGPAGKTRLSDFLNTQPAFLPLRGVDRLHFLHKRFISRVMPRPA
jgi:hypothetical protein